MHSYEVEGRGRVVVALAVVSILMIWLLHVVLDAFNFRPQWWLSVPSFAGCYSVLRWLFDRYMWNLGLLQELKLIQLPDLNGKWVGEVKSSYSPDGCAHLVSVDVMQRWSKILVQLETKQSRSRSIAASLKTSDLLNPELSYQYINEPKSDAPSTMLYTVELQFLNTLVLTLKETTILGEEGERLGQSNSVSLDTIAMRFRVD